MTDRDDIRRELVALTRTRPAAKAAGMKARVREIDAAIDERLDEMNEMRSGQ